MKCNRSIATCVFVVVAVIWIGLVVFPWPKPLGQSLPGSPAVVTNPSPELSVSTANAAALPSVGSSTIGARATIAPALRPPQAQYRPTDRFDPLQVMKDSLDLTDEQAGQLESALKAQQAALDALRRDAALSRGQRMAKLKEMRAATDAQLKSVLTPEQAEKWKKMRTAPLGQR